MERTRTGGAYIPPARLALMQKSVPQDPSSEAYQRVTWDTLKKSLNGHVNKVNSANLKTVVVELFRINLVRGRGLLARSLLKAQSSSLPFSQVYAALVAVLNSKLPLIGEFILKRLIIQFRKSFKRNDKIQCLATTTFMAHLVNQSVAHEILALEMLTLFLENPTDDSVELAVGFIRECGAKLQDMSPASFNSIFERLRHILHEGQIDKRVQYMIEVLFHVRKNNFMENPVMREDLDLIEEDDRVTHFLTLDDDIESQDQLFVFAYDPNYEENEKKYQKIKAEILGESDGEDSGEDDDDDDDDDDGSEGGAEHDDSGNRMEILDRTNTNLINMRKTIYLAIMSSLDFEECAHKLLKMKIAEGHEIELCNMVIECCSQERTFTKFYGLLAERFCKLQRNGRMWAEKFQIAWQETYDGIHRYETNRIRNIGKLFAFLLSADAISWSVFAGVHLTEAETTSASRIYLKIIFKELCEIMGLSDLKKRLQDPLLQESLSGIFPKDNLRDTRFAINYFTSIELGGITDDLRNFLKEAQLKEASAKATVVSEEESEESDAEPIRGDSRRSMSPRGDSHHSMSSPPRRDNRMNSDRADMLNDDREEDERGRRRRYSPRKRSVSPPNRMNSDRADMLNDDREEDERGRRRRYSPRKRSVSPPNRMNSDRADMLNDDREEDERGRRRRYSPRKRSVSPPNRMNSDRADMLNDDREEEERGRRRRYSPRKRSVSPPRAKRRRSSSSSESRGRSRSRSRGRQQK